MKLIVAGGRDMKVTAAFITQAVQMFTDSFILPKEVVSGCASGIDKCGENFAESWKLPIRRFPADWPRYGASAGPRRNAEMAAYGDALLLIWNGESKGSASMKREMLKLKKPVYEIILKDHSVRPSERTSTTGITGINQ